MDGKAMPIAELESENAKQLADHAAILQDLKFCIACCDRAIASQRDENKDLVLIRAMWTAGLVAYARCFATGVRYGLSPSLFDHIKGEPREAHEYYLALRNKHIAHSVNPFEQIEVGAVLSPADQEIRTVEGIATLVGANISESIQSIEQVRTLARTALEHIARSGKELEAKVLDEAKNLQIDDLYKRATPRVTVPPSTAASSRR